MKGRQRKNKRPTLWLILAAAGLVLLGVVLALVLGRTADSSDPSPLQEEDQNLSPAEDPAAAEIPGWSLFSREERALGQNLWITAIGSYTGAFVEDGSDRAVENVLAVMVTNRGQADVQYAEFVLNVAGGSAQFKLTTLTAGATVLVLESNAAAFQTADDGTVVLTTCAFFEKERSLYPEQFQLETTDGIINLTNVGEAVSGDVFVYYKAAVNGVFLGGITYRARVVGGLDAGEIRQMMSEHYSKENSKVLFLTYASE